MDFLSLEKGITLVYGVPASGKTTFCLQLAYDFTLHHKKVLMVSCEPLYLERFEQLAGTHFKECLSYFLALRVQTFQEQVQKVLELEHLKNISLILIDGFTTFYRKELTGQVKEINAHMVLMLRSLKHLSEKIPVILTSQVYQKLEEDAVEAVGGTLIKKFCATIIELKVNPRRLLMRKPSSLLKPFALKDQGFYFS